MDTLKECFKCHDEKPLDEFYRHSRMKDGHLNKCKTCTIKDVTEHRENNLEKVMAYDRSRGMLPHRVAARKEYEKTDAGKKAMRRASIKYIAQYPERKPANNLLYSALRSGKIKKEPCQKCGSTHRINGHHDDYYKPLDVKWLCAKHHKDYHKKEATNGTHHKR